MAVCVQARAGVPPPWPTLLAPTSCIHRCPARPKFVTTGFGHEATLGAAGLVLDAIKVRLVQTGLHEVPSWLPLECCWGRLHRHLPALPQASARPRLLLLASLTPGGRPRGQSIPLLSHTSTPSPR